MLATNRRMYEQVLSLEGSKDSDKINWSNFFDGDSIYKQIYRMEIVEAVMEEGDKGKGLDAARVEFIEFMGRSNLLRPEFGCESKKGEDDADVFDKLK